MTEKRFKVIRKSNGAYDHSYWLNDSESELDSVFDEGYWFHDDVKGVNMFCDLLNSLNDENEQLRNMVVHNYDERKRVINNYVDKIKELEKENGQLKKELEQCRAVIDKRWREYLNKEMNYD